MVPVLMKNITYEKLFLGRSIIVTGELETLARLIRISRTLTSWSAIMINW